MHQTLTEYAVSQVQVGLRDIPGRMHGGICRYILHGITPGHFLCAVIQNDLKEAYARADDENLKILERYLRFFHTYAPAACWGSPDKFNSWHGLLPDETEVSDDRKRTEGVAGA